MSYALSAPLQAAVYTALIADGALTALLQDHIYDAVPTGTLPETYVSLGQERVRDASDATGNGALHRLDVSIFTTQPGFAGAKQVAARISDVLHGANLALTRGRLVFLHFERAEARRIASSSAREIVLRFQARVDDD